MFANFLPSSISYSTVDLTVLKWWTDIQELLPNIILDLCQAFSHVYPYETRRFVYILAVIYARRLVY